MNTFEKRESPQDRAKQHLEQAIILNFSNGLGNLFIARNLALNLALAQSDFYRDNPDIATMSDGNTPASPIDYVTLQIAISRIRKNNDWQSLANIILSQGESVLDTSEFDDDQNWGNSLINLSKSLI